ncbi:MAG: elongation factor G [Chloroflexi bacterium]|nr:elongation factor G [Chloroflexota bacterium]
MFTKLNQMRNIGIIAHIDAGKTSTTERILFQTGMLHRSGSVDAGNTVTDFMPQERERGITIQSAAITCAWKDHQINLIDTPGHIDFTAEVQRSLRVLDGGVVVFDGVSGVEPQSETVWHQANRYGVPRICFVNKLDRMGASLDNTVGMIRDRLKAHPIVLQMPIGSESNLRGMIDLIEMRALIDQGNQSVQQEIPAELRDEARARRERMIEALADADDEIATLYLEGEKIAPETIRQALRRATLSNQATPVLCGSAFRGIAIIPLLDAVIAYLPSPLDIPPIVGKVPWEETEVVCHTSMDEPFTALIFKISTDPYVGRLAFFRVYSGVLRSGDTVLNASVNRSERIGRLVRMHADHREDIVEIGAGDIGAILGLKNARTGQTICATSHPVVLEEIGFPTPVINIAIAPAKRADQDRLSLALQRLSEEDPTLLVRTDERTEETILSGMGELHLDVVIDRLRREFRVEVAAGEPKVAYCESITRSARAEGRHVKQTGGHGQFAVAEIELEPLPRNSGFVFENKITGGAIPKEFIPAVEAGIIEAMKAGVVAKQPVVDVKATLVDGKFHEVDSSERAFEAAGMLAFRAAMSRGAPILLEPVMSVEATAPQEYTGDMINDLSSRAAVIQGIELRSAGQQSILANIPLAKMFGYATSLRSATQGRGNFTMQFSHYQQVSEETRLALEKRSA